MLIKANGLGIFAFHIPAGFYLELVER